MSDERQEARERLEPLLPAFKELKFTPAELGISGADENAPLIDLAQFLSDCYSDRGSLTVTVQQAVFEKIALRMKGLVDTMTGGTWVQPSESED